IEELNVPEDEPLWSIEDDTLFQPCGLISHSSLNNNKSKSVFVTWNEYYLINYRFKKSKKSNRMDMTMVRIPLPNHTQLRSIHMLEYNTLLLMSDGRVHCFGSIKSLHYIAWLQGVRAFARTSEGFSVILHNVETGQLMLQVFAEEPSLDKKESTLQHSYNITYDEQNIFQSDWHSDSYTLLTVKVVQQQQKFMQSLFGVDIAADREFHIFSIAGHIFALSPQDDSEQEYHIELLCVYATAVSFIRLVPARNLCLVFLHCGSVDIWYVSQLTGLKQRQMHFTGAEWLDYDASSENGDFYYTDGEQLVRLRFQYNAQLDDCQVQRCVKPVPGMQACTWVQDIEQVVCLSENNIFHRVAFPQGPNEPADDLSAPLNDLDPAAVERLRLNAQLVKQFEEKSIELLEAIKREHQKQQLVAVALNNIWITHSVEAQLEYRRQLPAYAAHDLLLYTSRQLNLGSSEAFAILQLHFLPGHELMHCSFWQLVVYQGQEVHMHRIPTSLLLSRNCRLIVPLKKSEDQRLPELAVKFSSLLESQTQYNAVLLPVQLKEDSGTYRALFSGHLHALDLYNKVNSSSILQARSPRKVRAKAEQRIKMPGCIDLEGMFDLCKEISCIQHNTLELYFFDSKIKVERKTEDNETVLTLQSEDVSALYYFKRHLFLNLGQ
ncbi:hypothetical protein KR222_008736, partial [Zaprionus bogoriensis]